MVLQVLHGCVIVSIRLVSFAVVILLAADFSCSSLIRSLYSVDFVSTCVYFCFFQCIDFALLSIYGKGKKASTVKSDKESNAQAMKF